MKIWLDDIRKPPDDSWTWVTTVDAARDLLITREVWVISLDNDLGGGTPEGRTLVYWMAENDRWPFHVEVHSANVVAAEYMKGMIERYKPCLPDW